MEYVGKHRSLSILQWLSPCLLIAFFSPFFSPVEARIRVHHWTVEYQFKSPDCFRKLAITINGQTPGPTIYAEQGDLVVVVVTNGLFSENLAIHWHGIRQIGTPWSDGTEGVTQCPVLPRENFTYKFFVDRAGTYSYHAHYGLQRSAGLNGMIVVAVPKGVVEPFSYDHEHSILLTDWWHNSTQEQATGLSSIDFTWVGEPHSLLIQGRGKFNCSLAGATDVCNTSSTDCSPHVLTVVPRSTYRIRIASLTSLSALNFEIEGHNMTVVETDGHYVEPFVVDSLFIYSGETYSVLVTANQDSNRNYWMATNVVSRKPDTPTGLAVLNYHPNPPERTPPTSPPKGPIWNDTDPRLIQSTLIRARRGYAVPPPPTSDRTIMLLNTQNKVDGHIKWSLNNVSFTLPRIPYLISLKKNLLQTFDQTPPPESYDYENYDIRAAQENRNATTSDSIYRLRFGSTVDVILQNANMLDNKTSDTHPWHLHGHDFWVLGYGIGKFDPSTDWIHYNLVDPIMKNTVPLHPYGWTAIRFRANNSGAWSFHCHIASHLFMGMGVVFGEGIDRIGSLPPSIMGCVPSYQRT